MIFPIFFICLHEIKNLYKHIYTFSSKEIAHSQLTKNNLVIIFNFIPYQLLFTIDKLFRTIVSLWIIKRVMNGKTFCFYLGLAFLLSSWFPNKEILGFLFDIKMFNGPFAPIQKDHLEIAISNKVQFMDFLSLPD